MFWGWGIQGEKNSMKLGGVIRLRETNKGEKKIWNEWIVSSFTLSIKT